MFARTLVHAIPLLLFVPADVVAQSRDASPEALYRRALTLAPVLQRKALVDAAARGSLQAAGRMIELGMWDDLARIDPRSDEASAWAGTGLTLDGMTAEQIHNVVQANWAAAGSKESADVQRIRAQIERDGVESPFIANALARLCERVEPRRVEKAQALRHDLAQAFEARAERADPMVRGACLHAAAESLRPDLVPGGDWALAAAMYGRAAQARDAAGDAAGSGDSLFEQAWCLGPQEQTSRDWKQAAELFARSARAREQVPDLSGCARSLYWQAWCLQPDHDVKGDWIQATALFARSAKLREQAGDLAACGESLFAQAHCLQPSVNPAGTWAQAVELLARSAALLEQAGDLAGAGQSLHEQAWCLQETMNPAGDWSQAASLAARAAQLRRQGGDLAGCGGSLFLQAVCLLHGGRDRSQLAAARAALSEAHDVLGQVPGSTQLATVDEWLASLKDS
ncbi:MAG TPA: hypothetical protein VFY71_11415 [Planctomycetota bacterium]|nr:hypothetical protein [Planctomycetota bacterium]